jgi:hypothetical protein
MEMSGQMLDMATLYPSPTPPSQKKERLSLVMVIKVNSLAPTKNRTPVVQSVASRTK